MRQLPSPLTKVIKKREGLMEVEFKRIILKKEERLVNISNTFLNSRSNKTNINKSLKTFRKRFKVSPKSIRAGHKLQTLIKLGIMNFQA